MPESLERFRRQFRQAWQLLGQVDWTSSDCNDKKAYVGALFAKVAYLEIPQFEVVGRDQAKVIPCVTHRVLVRRGTAFGVEGFLRESDFVDVFVIVREHVVVVGVRTPRVLIVSMRGTRPLYLSDWRTDFKAFRKVVDVDDLRVRFHSGFFGAMADCIREVSYEIRQRVAAAPGLPVWFVGHSLGGAMAAIAFAVDGRYVLARGGVPLSEVNNPVSCLAYGMPRYGNLPAVRDLPSPDQIYNDRDLVPGVPPQWLGFRNVPREYRVGADGKVVQRPQDRQWPWWWLQRGHLLRGVRHHFIERYILRLGLAAGVGP